MMSALRGAAPHGGATIYSDGVDILLRRESDRHAGRMGTASDPSRSIEAALDAAAKQGLWPVMGRARVLRDGPQLPCVLLPIERVRALSLAQAGYHAEGSLGETINTAVLAEVNDVTKATELETLRRLAAKYPDEGLTLRSVGEP